MEAARAAVAQHIARKGHFTNVDEVVRPAVTTETIKPHRHEVFVEAVDREVHRHHYHTTVQPLSYTETLPTKHTHNLLPVKSLTFQKDNKEATAARVAADLAAFKNVTRAEPTTYSKISQPAVVGEHWHHHVHEIVQPIVYKETLQREIVHTTVPIHEVHHNESRYHGLSALPQLTMEDFMSKHGDRLQGVAVHEAYDGEPRPYDSSLVTTLEKLGFGHPAQTHTTKPLNAASTTPKRNLAPIKTTTTTTTTNTSTMMSHKPHMHRRGSSSSSDISSPRSSVSVKTPTSPQFRQTHNVPPMPVTPTKMGTGQPIRVADGNLSPEMSPRYSNETGHRGFMSRLTGRAN